MGEESGSRSGGRRQPSPSQAAGLAEYLVLIRPTTCPNFSYSSNSQQSRYPPPLFPPPPPPFLLRPTLSLWLVHFMHNYFFIPGPRGKFCSLHSEKKSRQSSLLLSLALPFGFDSVFWLAMGRMINMRELSQIESIKANVADRQSCKQTNEGRANGNGNNHGQSAERVTLLCLYSEAWQRGWDEEPAVLAPVSKGHNLHGKWQMTKYCPSPKSLSRPGQEAHCSKVSTSGLG